MMWASSGRRRKGLPEQQKAGTLGAPAFGSDYLRKPRLLMSAL
ncbi:hypothetical protein EV659_10452 [Rhodothalassium salexigens DSM 2132]|uniref:Uncharacterized protein n=1 Tax=Rhodothalassium salexigens DSM 2132 TaxID=1188247 RepID=A0A4R2PIA2_RHOSA|nr:hypothetical protein [Rhodothalassium salexigens DSM 2132]TCP35202.1 hypothetical protein EV659_10452 [Rhodothalassium salexigens DSM 2132]